VTFAAATFPVPAVIVHVWLVGPFCPSSVTAYGCPLATKVANEKGPFDVRTRLSPPLSWSATLSPVSSPDKVPPTEYVLVVHAIWTPVTFAWATLPVPFVTTQF
jgi:hypothetical protein